MNSRRLVAASMMLALTACGGGGSGSGTSYVGGGTTGGGGTQSSGRATATLTFQTPVVDTTGATSSSRATTASTRSPKFVSPGLDKITLIVDGAKLLNDAELTSLFTSSGASNAFTSADNNTTVSFTATATGTYYTYVATIDTLPGSHTIGLEILGNAPAVILSEAQSTYTLLPGTNTPATLTLLGALSTSYVECASGPVTSTNCQSSFTATPLKGSGTGYYTLTAIGSDFDGFPIALQGTPAAPVAFDNGAFSVVETDGNAVLTLGSAGPFSNPGSQLTGPSGGFYVATQATYGQPFTASCNKTGTATVALTTTATGPTVPLSGETYTTFDPSNNFPTSGNYPGAGTLADGSKTPGNPAYHGGNNPNAVTTLSSINCDANLVLTVN